MINILVLDEIGSEAKSHQQLDHIYDSVLMNEPPTHQAETGKLEDQINTPEELRIFEKVLVVGLGQLGLPVAKYLTERGFETYGYDINNTAMERAEKVASVRKVTNLSEIDVFIICVSTHRSEDMFSPQVDGLLSIVEEISREAKNGALVSIESTIPRGTSKKVFEMLNHRLHVVHVPHRWYALEEKEHGVNQIRVIGGVCDCCLNAIEFYGYPSDAIENVIMNSKEGSSNSIVLRSSTADNSSNDRARNSSLKSTKNLGIPLHPVSNIEIAEISKIAENAHRYLQIAFAEDLYLYSQANGINFAELREALNTKWNVNILEPRDGIGGHCLPKDTKMFLQSSHSPNKSKILSAAIEVDSAYSRYRQAKNIASKQRRGSRIL
ncbi:MAG: potassium transporter TrkA [Nitrososphaeraceae archaeon]|nr:potassium transporter TrkA [Nitrososphaeraceae archaeon]